MVKNCSLFLSNEHSRFLRLAAAGVNVFVSSGDAGSNPGSDGQRGGPLQVESSASDSSIIAVGGTSLYVNRDGSVSGESGWIGSGGGESVVYPRPVWQQNALSTANNMRLVPDVSAVADPATAAFLILNGKLSPTGGTSWSAPIWAGFCARINEARAKAGKQKIGYLNPYFYRLPNKCFRDILSGNNGAYYCRPGYDQVTGLGVPVMKNIVDELTN